MWSYIKNTLLCYLKESGKLIQDMINEFSFVEIAEQQENIIELSKPIIINEYEKNTNEIFFFICSDTTLFIIEQSILDQKLFSLKPDMPFYFLSKKALEDFKEKTQIKDSLFINDAILMKEINNFKKNLVFLRIQNPQFTIIKEKILPCILGNLIRKSYAIIDESQKEMLNNCLNESSEPPNTEAFKENDYIELREIGKGCYIQSVLIYHIKKRKLFVIKKPYRISEEITNLKKRELDNYSNINHPFIPKYYGITEKNQFPIIQYIYGKTLDNFKIKDIEFNQKIIVIFKLMIVFNYLHKKGYIYRDLKPDNVMIDENFNIYLIDYDRMIKKEEAEQNDNFTRDFSENYVAPEVNIGKSTHKSDIYSIGKMIYYIINDDQIFQQNNDLKEIHDECIQDEPKNRPSITELMLLFYSSFNEEIDEKIAQYYHYLTENDPIEQFNLGLVYSESEFIEQDIDEALYYLQLSASNNYPQAQNILGRIYYQNNDFEMAILFFKKAAENKFESAQYNLGMIYYKNKDYENAFHYFNLASEKGNLNSQKYLGMMYYEGIYVERNIELAFKYLSNVADHGCVLTQCKLGKLYLKSKKYINKAIHYLTLAADNNDSESQYLLGFIYSDSNYVPHDIEKAIYYYSLAAEQNNSDAQNSIGMIYYEGKLVKQDVEKGMKYLLLAADQNNLSAIYNLGSIYYDKKDIKKSIYYFQIAADYNYISAQVNLAIIYLEGEYVNQDINKSIHYFTLASKQNNSSAQFFLGLLYLNNSNLTNNINKGLNYLDLAANNYYKGACFLLGVIYSKGEKIKKNIERSISYYKEGSSYNDSFAKNNLAMIYFHGIGVKENEQYAIELLKEAVDLDDPLAMYNLAHIYFYKENSEVNDKKIIDLLINSAVHDDNELPIDFLSFAIFRTNKAINDATDSNNSINLDELSNKNINLSKLSDDIHMFIESNNLNNPKNYEYFYQQFRNEDYVYDWNYQVVETISLTKENTKKIPKTCKDIDEIFYDGFGLELQNK